MAQIIIKNNIRFSAIQSKYELFSFQYLLHIESIKEINYKGYCFIRSSNLQSSFHKYIAELNCILLMNDIYSEIYKRLNINYSEYFDIIKQRFAKRYTWYLLKGYFKDTRVSYKVRMNRWHNARKNQNYRKCPIRSLNY